jgi:hypothetical protein
VQPINQIADDDRRADPFGNLVDAPLDVRFGDVARTGRINCHARTASAAVAVYNSCAVRCRRCIPRSPTPPQELAAGRIKTLNASVGFIDSGSDND